MTLNKKAFENIVGKGTNAGNQHFLLFHNVFYPVRRKIYPIGERNHHFINTCYAVYKAFDLDPSKFLSSGKVLICDDSHDINQS